MNLGEQEFEPKALPSWAQDLTASFDIARTVEAVVVADLAAAWPQRTDDVEFADLLRASVKENVTRMLRMLAGEGAETPLVRPAEFARAQAEFRIPQSALQQSYRAGFRVIWKHWFDHLSHGARSGGIDPASLTEAVERSTLLLFRYQDMALSAVAAEFSRVEQVMRTSAEHVRHQVIRQILVDSGDPLPVRDLYLTLGYDVSGAHVAVQTTGTGEELDAIASRVRRTCHATSLRYEVDEKHSVIWFGRSMSWTATQRRDLAQVLTDASVRGAISTARGGVEGLRSTFEEVHEVDDVRGLLGAHVRGPVTSFDEVWLEALLCRDLPRARGFVLDELGGLAGEGPEVDKLRDTLLVWLASGSHVGTADALHLHEHTVRNRLRRAEEHLGHLLSERRIEVGVALRLFPMVRREPVEPEGDIGGR